MNNAIASQRPSDRPLTLIALLLLAANLRPALASLGPVLESLRNELNLSRSEAGYLSSIPIVCMGLFAPLTMVLQRSLGLKQSMLAALLLTATGTTLRALSYFNAQLLSAVCVGSGIAVLGPLLSAYIKQAYGTASGRISAWTTTALCLGATAAAAFSADLATMWHWNIALASFSVPAWVAAWLWWRMAPALPPLNVASNFNSPWRSLRGWMLLLCFGCNSLVFYALLAWLAPLLSDAGLTPIRAGHQLGWFALLQIAGTMQVAWFAGPQHDRRIGLWLFGLATLAGLLGLWRMPLQATIVWMALLGMGTAGLFALTLILPLDFSKRSEDAAAWTAMMNGGGYLIAAAGPYLCGLLRDLTHSYDAPLILLCAATMLALLSGSLLKPSTIRTKPAS